MIGSSPSRVRLMISLPFSVASERSLPGEIEPRAGMARSAVTDTHFPPGAVEP